MPITDADQALVVMQLIHDLHATLGREYEKDQWLVARLGELESHGVP